MDELVSHRNKLIAQQALCQEQFRVTNEPVWIDRQLILEAALATVENSIQIHQLRLQLQANQLQPSSNSVN
jgi:Mg2+ and Co2+ transporter CorA